MININHSLGQWTWDHVSHLLDCECQNLAGCVSFSRIQTDSRSIAKGDVFLALKGDRFDGHDFLGQAIEAGASGLIIMSGHEFDPLGLNIPCLRVMDTLEAYGELALARRTEWGGPVLAIGGSAGKTTTRRLVAASLDQEYKILQPFQNFNNLVGVPHTLMRLASEHEVTVLELGMNQPGELARLARIADPTAALLTQIGRAHIGMFDSHADLVSAKLDLFRNCRPGTPLVVNAQCPNTRTCIDEFREYPLTNFSVEAPDGTGSEADVFVHDVDRFDPVGYRFSMTIGDVTRTKLELPLFGRHQLDNVAAAAALLLAMDFDPFMVCGGLEDFHLERCRGEVVRVGDWTFILDCYNATPSGMQCAIRSLSDLGPGGRLVIVLADMLELGDHAKSEHDSLIPLLIQARPAMFLGLGERCTELAGRLENMGIQACGYGSDRQGIVEALAANLEPGDRVFFKGSHGFELEAIARAIMPDMDLFGDGSE